MKVVISDALSEKIIQYRDYISKNINSLIEDADYSEISNYLAILPKSSDNEDSLFSWGRSFINEYYKAIGLLDSINEMEFYDLKKQIYVLYLKEIYGHIILSYKEFITFSRLLNVTFTDYNPKLIRREDNNPYKEDTQEINAIINKIVRDELHTEHPYAYEINKFNLDVLIDCLQRKRESILNFQIDKVDLDDFALKEIFSEKRIKKLKDKTNK